MSRPSSCRGRLRDSRILLASFLSFLQIPNTTEGNITQFQLAVANLSILASVFYHIAAFIGHGWCPQAYLVKQRFLFITSWSWMIELSDVKQTRGTAGQNTFLNYFIRLYFDNSPIQKSSDLAMVGVSDLFPFFLLNWSSRTINLNEGWAVA